MFSTIRKAKKTEYFDSIQRYQPSPPNNRLLGDKHYKKVRETWLKLNEIDNVLRNDISKLERELAIVFFLLILHSLTKSSFRMQQEIILLDLNSFDIKMFVPKVEFIVVDSELNHHIGEIWLEESNVFIQVIDDLFRLEFDENNVTLHKERALFTEVITGDLEPLLSKIIQRISKEMPKKFAPIKIQQIFKNIFKNRYNLVIDLYSTNPKILYLQNILPIDQKIILLKYKYDKSYRVMVGDSTIIPVNDSVDIITLDNVFRKDAVKEIPLFLECFRQYNFGDIHFVYPDKFNEIQLKAFHKSNLHYFSKSMGMVFDFQYNHNFDGLKFKDNDFILSIDYIYDNVTFTLIKAKFDIVLNEKVPSSAGIAWVRYPTTSVEVTTYIDRVVAVLDEFGCPDSKLLVENFGVENLVENCDVFSYRFDDGFFHLTSEIVDRISAIDRINIDKLLNNFLTEKASLIGNGKVVKLCCTNIFKGMDNKFNWLQGYDMYSSVQTQTPVTLWSDYVPSLYLKRLDKNFTLCDGENVTVAWGVKHKMVLENEFMLASGISKFEFPLVYNDELIPTNKAVLMSNAFPLTQPVVCKVTMIYEFGGEEPFKLLFNSIDSKSAGFNQVKAKFQPITSYECEELISPPFSQQFDWELFYRFPKENSTKTNNLIDWSIDTFRFAQEELHSLDLVEENVFWRNYDDGNHYAFVNYKGSSVKISENNFRERFNPSKNVIHFTLEEDRRNFRQYIAKNITYSRASLNEIKLNKIRSGLFPFHTIFFDLRDIDDAKSPYFRQEIENGYSILKEKLSQNLSEKERNIYFTIIGLISHLIDDDWSILVKNYMETKNYSEIKIGLFLGDLTKDQQLQTFAMIMYEFTSKKDITNKLIPIFSVALWKSKDFLFKLNDLGEDFVIDCLHASIDFIVQKAKDVERLKTARNFELTQFSTHLEFILAILRLRELKTLNSKLSMNDPKIQTLVSTLEHIKKNNVTIKPNLRIKSLSNNEKNPLVNMLLKYLYNDTLDESFIILPPTS